VVEILVNGDAGSTSMHALDKMSECRFRKAIVDR